MWFNWVVLAITILLAISGAILWGVVERRWRWMSRFYTKHRLKPWLQGLDGLAAAVAIFFNPTAPGTENLSIAVRVIAICAVVFWKVIDIQASAKAEVDRADYEELLGKREAEIQLKEKEINSRAKLIWFLEQVVVTKRQRVVDALATATPRERGKALQRALAPEQQTIEILHNLCWYFHDSLPEEWKNGKQNFRVGLYVENGGVMKPIDSWDHHRKKRQFFRSYNEHQERYRLDCQIERLLADPHHRFMRRRVIVLLHGLASRRG